ncbi:MAG: O-antigen ligase family protein [Actinomycetota bacterium]|nr:O-antigen ligase family protein [Actinomycetota bacterium]
MTAVVALVVAGALLVWFNRLERTGRSITVVAALFGLIFVEALVYESQNTIPTGLFHPEYRSLSFRLIDIVIPVAVLAHVLGRTRGRPVHTSVLLWLALLLWLAAAGLLGVYEDNGLKLVGFHGKVIVYLGALVIAAGVPLQEYLAPGRLERFLQWVGAAALAFIAFDIAGLAVTRDLPLLALKDFGVMGSDAATIFSSLGALALVLGLLTEHGRGRMLAAAVPLLAAPAVADQRAAFIALAASLGLVVVVTACSRRRVRVTPTEVGLAAIAVAGLLLLSTMGAIATGGEVKAPLQDRLTTTFTSYEEVLTTRDRLNQWRAARPLIEERPILGWGLGKEYAYYNPGLKRFEKIDLTHNILGDLLLRSGLVGLGLFGLALATTSVSLARGWRWHESDRAAAFALGAGAVVAGLIGKGMAESIFEKYRLAVVLGLGIGAMISAGLPAEARVAVRSRPQGSPSTSKDRISPRMPARS